MITSCAVRDSPLLMACLGLTCTIGCSGNKRIGPCSRGKPGQLPKTPAIGREGLVQTGLLPGHSVIYAHFDALNTPVPGESYATDLNRLPQRQLATGMIDAANRVQWAIIPALAGVETLHKVVGQLHTCQPLGVLLAITARDEDAQGITVTYRQFRAVHTPDQ